MGAARSYPGKVLFSCSDEHGPIDIVEEANSRSMHFGTPARQSTMLVDTPDVLVLAYSRCMAGALLLVDEPRRALLLGLGGGSLAKYLLTQLPGCRVEVAEMRPRVVDLARAFFALPDDQRLEISLTSAERFLASIAVGSYDLILVDIHNRNGMAPAQGDPAFYPACVRHLARGGVLAANLWTGGGRGLLRQVRRRMRVSFSNCVFELPVSGTQNTVAFGFPVSPDAAVWSRARERAAVWGRRAGVDFPILLRDLERHALALRR